MFFSPATPLYTLRCPFHNPVERSRLFDHLIYLEEKPWGVSPVKGICAYPVERSRTLILRIIPAASKPGTMPPFHTDVRGALPWCRIFFSTSSH